MMALSHSKGGIREGIILNSYGLTLWRSRLDRYQPYKLTTHRFGPITLMAERTHN